MVRGEGYGVGVILKKERQGFRSIQTRRDVGDVNDKQDGPYV